MVVVATACSGRAPAPTQTGGTGGAGGERPRPSTDGSTADRGSAGDGKPADAQCVALVDHVIALDVSERPADQQVSTDQLTAMRVQLRETYVPQCREQPRPVVECALGAKTTAALRACER